MKHIEGTNPTTSRILPCPSANSANSTKSSRSCGFGSRRSPASAMASSMRWPAAYVLKYLDLTTTLEFVNVRLWTWKDGTQSIYEAVNKHLRAP
jgi:hypothetical protein